jgi:hypothetical protein
LHALGRAGPAGRACSSLHYACGLCGFDASRALQPSCAYALGPRLPRPQPQQHHCSCSAAAGRFPSSHRSCARERLAASHLTACPPETRPRADRRSLGCDLP